MMSRTPDHDPAPGSDPYLDPPDPGDELGPFLDSDPFRSAPTPTPHAWPALRRRPGQEEVCMTPYNATQLREIRESAIEVSNAVAHDYAKLALEAAMRGDDPSLAQCNRAIRMIRESQEAAFALSKVSPDTPVFWLCLIAQAEAQAAADFRGYAAAGVQAAMIACALTACHLLPLDLAVLAVQDAMRGMSRQVGAAEAAAKAAGPATGKANPTPDGCWCGHGHCESRSRVHNGNPAREEATPDGSHTAL